MDHIGIASVSCFADSIVMLNLYVVHFMLKPRVNGSCSRTRGNKLCCKYVLSLGCMTKKAAFSIITACVKHFWFDYSRFKYSKNSSLLQVKVFASK
jgi:hypothetical protein